MWWKQICSEHKNGKLKCKHLTSPRTYDVLRLNAKWSWLWKQLNSKRLHQRCAEKLLLSVCTVCISPSFLLPGRKNFCPWASEGFFPGGGNSGFLQVVAKRIFQRGPSVMKFHFTNSKLRENIFLLKGQYENFKFQNLRGPKPGLHPLSDAHASDPFNRFLQKEFHYGLSRCGLQHDWRDVQALLFA